MKISDLVIPSGVDFKKFRNFARNANYYYDSHEKLEIEKHIRNNELATNNIEIKENFNFLLKHKYIKYVRYTGCGWQ